MVSDKVLEILVDRMYQQYISEKKIEISNSSNQENFSKDFIKWIITNYTNL
jgi:hypothetical protein